MESMLEAHDLSVEIGGRLTLAGASFAVKPGDKVGLVGRNGAGKTSLLKVLSGELAAAGGSVRLQGALGFLSQDPRHLATEVEASGLAHVLSGRQLDEAAHRMEKLRLAMEEDPSERAVHRYSRAEERFAAAGGYAAEAEVRRLVAGLGLSGDRLDLPVGVLSGGERRRLELARILFAGSEVLLLDEPTNHLDSDAKAWLVGFLRAYRGALLVVSHDIEMLDSSITRVLHLDDGALVEYKGTYSQYVAARKAGEARQAKLAVRQAAEIKRLSDLAESMRHQTEKRARIAKTLDKRVSQLRRTAVAAPARRERRYRVHFPPPPHTGRMVIEADNLAKAYDAANPVFTDVSFAVERGQRLLVMGLNGAGKTSLLRILAGLVHPTTGSWRSGVGVSVGYYAQEHEGIVAGRSVLDHMRQESGAPEVELRGLLGMFGLVAEKATQDAGTLSGGEKTKLALAQLVAGSHNCLLLDEPTNNLDPPSREGIGRALSDWPGTMVVVSHDSGFVAELAPDRVLMMPEGTEDAWDDGLLELVSLA
ncbi:MAG TPA: ABC-F family ATP-binding cassette domain-containing protein [Acidimicrobiales bacterium]|nr:ABC-F family ATP-binding cassette domain-containing protein [Acidimicrobiales bacterium]